VSIPVIVISAMDSQKLPGGLDVIDWFVKPISREDLIRRLRLDCPQLLPPARPLAALVVDDEPASRKLLNDLLATEGVEVRQASGGVEALARLDEAVPDLLILDLLMPETDGFAVVEAVRSQPRFDPLQIVIVTAKDITSEDRGRLNGNIQAVLSKSRLTPEKMAERLRKLRVLVEAG
jgi:CheY-like chemotaxis protein